MTKQTPISPYIKTHGMLYFARMLDKIRKYAANELREDFHKSIGIALDGRCCAYFRVDYAEVRERTLAGGSDEEIFTWCQEHGRSLDENDILIWNEYTRKIGWNDERSQAVENYKAESGLRHREDIHTMFDFMEADEGRDGIQIA
jgi:gluconokinase